MLVSSVSGSVLRQADGVSVGHLLFSFFAGLGVPVCAGGPFVHEFVVEVAVLVLGEVVAYLDCEGYLVHGRGC